MSFEQLQRLEGSLSLKQIFNYTPAPETMISSCMIRPHDFLIKLGAGLECLNYFSITRFFTQDMVCYNIKQIRSSKLPRTRVTTASFYRNAIYEVDFSHEFTPAKSIHVIGYSNGDVRPWVSREYSSTIADLIDNEVKKYNYIWSRTSSVDIIRLEPPYDTKCVNRGEWIMYYCYHECLVHSLMPTGMAATWEMYMESEGYDLKPLPTIDLENRTLYDEVTSKSRVCRNRCMFIACSEGHTKTMTLSGWRTNCFKTDATPLKFAYVTPIETDTEIRSLPNMRPIDFFVYICSCISTWFGLSFVSLWRLKKYFILYRQRKRYRERRIHPRPVHRPVTHAWHPRVLL